MSQAAHASPSLAAACLSAVRPATLSAAVAPVVVGSALAAAEGALVPAIAAAALAGAVLIQIGCNLYNDYGDFKRGADTAERVGPARAVARGWLSPRQVVAGALASLAAAALIGCYLVAVGGWPILLLGLTSIAAAVLYTAGPAPLAYVGLGDVFVLLFFGLGAVSGTYYLQAGVPTLEVVAASLAVGALTTAILVVNNVRDEPTDRRAGKRTLVVRFGRRFGVAEHGALLAFAYSAVALVAAARGAIGWALPLGSAPLALALWRRVRRGSGAALNPELGATARLGLLFAALLSLGVLL
jgi:1,4-dihydroxy-2-naphthoate octaprenyltransferase